jgi:hypothetical protein
MPNMPMLYQMVYGSLRVGQEHSNSVSLHTLQLDKAALTTSWFVHITKSE